MKRKSKNIEHKTKEEIFLENLRDIKEIFDKHNIKFWLDWGTLLGAVREGKIIEWDHDIDLGIMAEDFKKNTSVFSEIKKRGFFLKEPLILEPKVLVLNVWRFGYNVGIWPYSIMDKDALVAFHGGKVSRNPIARSSWFLWRLLECDGRISMPINKFQFVAALFIKHFILLLPRKSKKLLVKIVKKILTENNYLIPLRIVVPKHYFERFKTVKFYDMEFKVPSDAEGYLEYKYGPDWKTPKRKWAWANEDGAVKHSVSEKIQG